MKQNLQALLRVALPAAMLLIAPSLRAQKPDSVKRKPPVVRDSAAGTLGDTEAQFGRLIAAINNTDVNGRRFLAISGLRPEQIVLVDARNLLRGDSQKALDEALGRRENQIASLRNDLQNSMILRDLLVTRDVPMSQVVAVDVSPDGSTATVYYRPQE